MKFISLEKALDGWYDKPLADLPPDLRARVKEEFSPFSWDDSAIFNAARRQQYATQCDEKNDPALEPERKYWWDFALRKQAIERDIVKWQLIDADKATDLALKENRLLELMGEIEKMEKEEAKRCDPESPTQRRTRLRAEVNAEKTSGTKGFNKVVADREGITVGRLNQILCKAGKSLSAKGSGLKGYIVSTNKTIQKTRKP